MRRRGPKRARTVVVLDDGRLLELSSAVAEKAGLRTGQELTPADLERLVAEDADERAREKALRLLTARERSATELERRLLAAGTDRVVVARTVAWLRERGYVDDRRFAQQFAAEKCRAGWGSEGIRLGLLRKGIERPVIDLVLEEFWQRQPGSEQGEARMASVIALARRRFGPQFSEDPEKAARKLAGFLARRGHDWEAISHVEAILRAEARADEQAVVEAEAEDGGGRAS